MLTDFQNFFILGLSSDCVMNWFLPVRHTALAMERWLAGCLSHVGIVSKWLKLS